MNVIGIEDGVRRALTAYLVERGASAEAAAEKAEDNLAAGIALVRNALAPTGPSRPEAQLRAAMASLKEWSASIDL